MATQQGHSGVQVSGWDRTVVVYCQWTLDLQTTLGMVGLKMLHHWEIYELLQIMESQVMEDLQFLLLMCDLWKKPNDDMMDLVMDLPCLIVVCIGIAPIFRVFFRGFRFVPGTHFRKRWPPQMVKGDLNIGFPLFGFDSGPNLQCPCIFPFWRNFQKTVENPPHLQKGRFEDEFSRTLRLSLEGFRYTPGRVFCWPSCSWNWLKGGKWYAFLWGGVSNRDGLPIFVFPWGSVSSAEASQKSSR